MKILNIKQDIIEIKKSFKLLKDAVRDFIKKHLLFKQGIKSFFIVLKWMVLLSLIIYSFWYFPYLWKKSKIIKYQKNLILLEQKLYNCMDNYSMPQYCKINIAMEEPLSHLVNYSYLPYKNSKIIAKSSNEEFNKYIEQTKQYENKLSKQIAICHKKASILEKEKDSIEKQEVILNLSSALSFYITSEKNRKIQPIKNDHGRADNFYDIQLKHTQIKIAEEMFSKIIEMKNKCTISELKSKLHYYNIRTSKDFD